MKRYLTLVGLCLFSMWFVVSVWGQEPNDPCSGAIPISVRMSSHSYMGDMGGAHADTVLGQNGIVIEHTGVWFTFLGDGLRHDLSTCNNLAGSAGTRITLFKGTCDSLVFVASAAANCWTDRAKLTLVTDLGARYYVLISHVTGMFWTGLFRLDITEHVVAGAAGPDQNVCYGGTPYELHATGFPAEDIAYWQSRDVGYLSMNSTPQFYSEWRDISGTAGQLSYQPKIQYGGRWFRPVIDTGGGLFPAATPAQLFSVSTIANLPTSGDCTCRIWTDTTDWCVFFRDAGTIDWMFYVFNAGNGINLGETYARSTAHPAVIDVGGNKFVPRSLAMIPSIESHGYLNVFFVITQSEFDALKASDTAYVNKTLSDLRVVRFDGDVPLPNGAGEVIPTAVAYQNTYGFQGSHAIGFLTDKLGTFFLTFDSYSPSPLPITLAQFSGDCVDGNKRMVSWTTASESNNAYFFIERTRDLVTWSLAAPHIAGAGNSNSLIDYTWLDTMAFDGSIYYRLSQVDFNGATTMYAPIAITCLAGGDYSFEVFPNPAPGIFFVKGVFPEGNTDMQLVSLSGQVVMQTMIIGDGTQQHLAFDVRNHAAGTYVLTVKSPQRDMQNFKIITIH